ncbi:MAG: hypothetical protein ACREX8_04200 [Gammaproteobacteria bacterium]
MARKDWDDMTPVEKRTGKITAVVLAATAGLIMIGACGSTDQEPVSTVPTIGELVVPATSAPVLPVVDIPTGDGQYAVGPGLAEVTPGKYRTAGPDGSNSAGCYWARLSDTDGELSSILANSLADGPQMVTIKPSDGYFETMGCNGWTKIS